MEFINLSSTASTLLITLYSRANMSRQGLIIKDEKAEEIIQLAGYSQKKLKTRKSHQSLWFLRNIAEIRMVGTNMENCNSRATST